MDTISKRPALGSEACDPEIKDSNSAGACRICSYVKEIDDSKQYRENSVSTVSHFSVSWLVKLIVL